MEDVAQDLIYHRLQAALWKDETQASLVVGDVDNVIVGEFVAEQLWVIRYGIPLLGTPHIALVPAWYVTDRGAVLRNWQAWQFLRANYQQYPRAEIFGVLSNGKSSQTFIRELDFTLPLHVFLYDSLPDLKPIVRITRLHIAANAQVPTLLIENLLS